MSGNVIETKRRGVALLFMFALTISAGCGGANAASSTTTTASPDPLARASVDILSREACPRLLVRTFSLDAPKTSPPLVSGKLWVRRCEARVTDRGSLHVDVDVLGWQWADESSWGFGVSEYVYFTAAVRAELTSWVDETPALHVRSLGTPRVTVNEIGRVSARAESFASTIFGVASSIVGKGPNALATAAFRDRVRDLIEERAKSGIAIALGEATVPGQPSSSRAAALLDETEWLHADGALLSGSYEPGIDTELRWRWGDGAPDGGDVLVRPVCVDEAIALVDSVVARGRANPQSPAAPQNVVRLTRARDREGVVKLPAMPCRWMLVAGSDAKDTRISLSLGQASSTSDQAKAFSTTKKRWMRATVIGFELDASSSTQSGSSSEQQLIALKVGPSEASLRSLGQPLAASRSSPAIWLVSDPFEIDLAARNDTLLVTLTALEPKSRSILSGAVTYEETVIGSARIAASPQQREERTVPIERAGQKVGSLRVDLETIAVTR